MGFRPSMCDGCKYFPECRLPDGRCKMLQNALTPRWTVDFTAAVEIYYRTVALSGCDMNGKPQLTMLQFVMEHTDYEIDDDAAFLDYISALHNMTILSRKK